MDNNLKKQKRFEYLNLIYKQTNGSTSEIVDATEIGKQIDLSYRETEDIVDYLTNERLLKFIGKPNFISLDHQGIKAVENAIENPNQATKYFAPINNYHFNIHASGEGSVINTGSHNKINLNFNNNTDVINSKIDEIINAIRHDNIVLHSIKEDAVNTFEILRAEVGNNHPSQNVMDKIFAYGGSISSIGSLVVGLIQLLTK